MRRRAGLGRRTLEPIEFNFAPMVDVVLILVIFFMLAANLNRPDRAFPVDLPQASTAQAVPQAPLVIALSQSGQVALNGRVVSPAALEGELRQALKNPNRTVLLEADKAATHGKVVSLINLVRLAGGTRLEIATLP